MYEFLSLFPLSAYTAYRFSEKLRCAPIFVYGMHPFVLYFCKSSPPPPSAHEVGGDTAWSDLLSAPGSQDGTWYTLVLTPDLSNE